MEVNNEVNKKTDLHTQSCCFLCWESNGIKGEEKQLFSIQSLLQYLQIKCLDEVHFKDLIRVDLCEKCETVLNGFTLAVEELEKAQMKVNSLLEKINNSISGPGTDSSMQDSRKMAADSKDSTQFAFVDNLRKKIETKCLELQSGSIPSVKIKMAEVIPSQPKEDPCNDEEDPSPLEDLNNDNFEAPDSVEVILPSIPSPDLEQDNFEEEVNPTVSENLTCREPLEERLEKEEETKKMKLNCDLCGKTFGNRNALTTHRLEVHRNINRFPCDLCSKKFSKLCNLKEHQDVVHFGKVYHCQFCYTQLRSRTGVGSHERICKQKSKNKT